MKLSVIVPMFNSEKTIKNCLLSVVESFKEEEIDLELVVVDDGSKDSSVSIVKKLGDELKNISLYENDWGGVSKARNTALSKATGDYIMFVDSDDHLLKWNGKSLKEILSKNDDIIFLETKKNYYSLKEDSRVEIIREFCDFYPDRPMVHGPMSKFFKKSFIIENNILFNVNLRMAEDVIFNLESLSKYKQISCYKTVVYDKGPASSMNLFKESNLENEKVFREEYSRIIDYLNNEELDLVKDRYAISGFLFLLDRYYAPALVLKKLNYTEVYKSMVNVFHEYKSSLKINQFDFTLGKKDKILRKLLERGLLRTALILSIVFFLLKKYILRSI